MMRLRQVALVAKELESTVARIRGALDLGEPFHDPGVEVFGLHNAVLPIGDTFLEVVSPLRDDCSGARYLQRRGGDGGYMVIVQTDGLPAARQRIETTRTRIVFEVALEDIATIHLHPRDTRGTLLSIDASTPPAEWRWAGPDWRARTRTTRCSGLAGVEIQCEEPFDVAARWSRLLDRPAMPCSEGGEVEIPLDGSALRFVPLRDHRGEGLHTVLLRRAPGVPAGEIELCGTRFRL
jgi:hypothetical protein